MSAYKPHRKYKDSDVEWIGQMPSHWTVAPTFAKTAESKAKNSLGLEDNVLSLSYGNIVKRNVEDNFGLMPESFNTYQIVKRGDVILRLTDLQNDKRSLRVGLVKEAGIITSAYLNLRGKSEIEPSYLYRLLHSYDTTKVFYGMGGGLRQSMKFEDFRRLPLLLPPLPEQRQIAAFLDRECGKLDALQAKQERLIELLKEKRQALISHAVTRGLDPAAKLKPSGVHWLGDVPEHWEVTRLKFVANIQTGIAKGKDNAGRATVSVPYLRVANVQDGYLALDDVATIEIPVEDLPRYSLRPGDVLMNEGGDFDKLGRGHVWRGEVDPCIHQNHVFAIRPILVSCEWLSALTSSNYAQFYFMSRSKQSTNLASLSSTNLMELPLLRPPFAEQRAIVEHLNDKCWKIDQLKAKAERGIELLKERRSALISAAVTGKIDVRDKPN